MSTESTCPECRGTFPADASPGGVCPRCLLALGLAGDLEESPERIGPYTVLRPLGEGGMGSVYLAEQEGPLHRRVAVKVIKLGMDTREVVARFETERQVLAMLSHPSIAKVFEAGSTERGRPYFVMELVEGERITDHCDRQGLGVPERLELFLQVCSAVQHAHQKGVLHRDLKPSNVLVEDRDGEAVPKVIDFGVAKATGPGAPEMTLLTRRGAWVGTPAYMSPEAARSGALEADARSDIYALGVLLYELLCGALPFDPERLHRAADEEVRRIVRDEDPPPPSQRLAALGPEAEEVGARRGTDPATLRRKLRGDLDWIVLRAMAKDRDRRYPSASELAADVSRHLQHEAVVAGPPGAAYRLSKGVRRHRVAVAAGGAVLLALVLGVVGTTAGLLQARAAERTALQEARTAQAVSEFLVGLFEVSDPGEARGNSVTAREILDAGAREIREGLEEEPLVRARLLGTMGTVYRKLGLYEEAAGLLEDAVRLREGEAEGDPLELAQGLEELGTLAVELGRFERGRELLDRAQETLRQAPEAEGAGAARAEVLKELAVLHYRRGELDRAEPLYRESLELARGALGEEHPLVAWNLNDLGNVARDLERFEEAEELFRRSLELHEAVYGPDHPYVGNNLNNLANSLQYQGFYEQALPLRRRAQAIYEKTLGPEHRISAIGLTNQAVLHHRLGHYERAEGLYRRALEVREGVLGPEHPDVAVSLYQLAGLYRDQGLYERAEPVYERALEVGETALGSGHHRMAAILRGAAALHRDTGLLDEAEALARRALEVLEGTLPPDHSRIAAARAELADLLARQGRPAEAQPLLEQALTVQRALHAGNPEDRLQRTELADGLVVLGRIHRLRGDPESGRRAWAEAAELVRPVAQASDAVDPRHTLAVALLHLERTDEARPLVDGLLATGWRHPDLLELTRRHGLV